MATRNAPVWASAFSRGDELAREAVIGLGLSLLNWVNLLNRDSTDPQLDFVQSAYYKFTRLMYGKAVRIRHCPATVIAESRAFLATDFEFGKAAPSSMTRKSGDRSGPNHLGYSSFDGRAGQLLQRFLKL